MNRYERYMYEKKLSESYAPKQLTNPQDPSLWRPSLASRHQFITEMYTQGLFYPPEPLTQVAREREVRNQQARLLSGLSGYGISPASHSWWLIGE